MNKTEQKEFSVVETIKELVKIIQYILSKWLIIFVVCLVCSIIGIGYAWMQKPVYVAEMTFVADEESSAGMGMYAGIAAQFGLDIGQSSSSAFEGENLIAFLKSNTLIRRTLLTPADKGQPLLIDQYITYNQLNKDWQNKPELKNIHFEDEPKSSNRTTDSILKKVYENIINDQLEISKKDKKNTFISIEFESTNELFAKHFIEVLTSNAIQYYTDYKIKRSRQNVEILQKQTDSVKRVLYGSISNIAILNDLNVNPTRQSVKIGSQYKQIDAQVNGTLYGELLKNLELAKLSLRKETPLIQVIDTPQLPLDKNKPGRIKTGLIFAIVGFTISIILLVIKRWLKEIKFD